MTQPSSSTTNRRVPIASAHSYGYPARMPSTKPLLTGRLGAKASDGGSPFANPASANLTDAPLSLLMPPPPPPPPLPEKKKKTPTPPLFGSVTHTLAVKTAQESTQNSAKRTPLFAPRAKPSAQLPQWRTIETQPPEVVTSSNSDKGKTTRTISDMDETEDWHECKICSVKFTVQTAYQQHCRGIAHTTRMLMRGSEAGVMKNAPPPPVAPPATVLALPGAAAEDWTECTVCAVKFRLQTAYQGHLTSLTHKTRLLMQEKGVKNVKKKDERESSKDSWKECKACDVKFEQEPAYQQHCRGLAHTTKVLATTPKNNAGAQKENDKVRHVGKTASEKRPADKNNKVPREPGPYAGKPRVYCKLCDIYTTDQNLMKLHLNGKKHQLLLMKSRGLVVDQPSKPPEPARKHQPTKRPEQAGKQPTQRPFFNDPKMRSQETNGPARVALYLDSATKEPLIGLEKVVETINAETNTTSYICELCNYWCTDKQKLVSHLIDKTPMENHRLLYLQEAHPKLYAEVAKYSYDACLQSQLVIGKALQVEKEMGRIGVRQRMLFPITEAYTKSVSVVGPFAAPANHPAVIQPKPVNEAHYYGYSPMVSDVGQLSAVTSSVPVFGPMQRPHEPSTSRVMQDYRRQTSPDFSDQPASSSHDTSRYLPSSMSRPTESPELRRRDDIEIKRPRVERDSTKSAGSDPSDSSVQSILSTLTNDAVKNDKDAHLAIELTSRLSSALLEYESMKSGLQQLKQQEEHLLDARESRAQPRPSARDAMPIAPVSTSASATRPVRDSAPKRRAKDDGDDDDDDTERRRKAKEASLQRLRFGDFGAGGVDMHTVGCVAKAIAIPAATRTSGGGDALYSNLPEQPAPLQGGYANVTPQTSTAPSVRSQMPLRSDESSRSKMPLRNDALPYLDASSEQRHSWSSAPLPDVTFAASRTSPECGGSPSNAILYPDTNTFAASRTSVECGGGPSNAIRYPDTTSPPPPIMPEDDANRVAKSAIARLTELGVLSGGSTAAVAPQPTHQYPATSSGAPRLGSNYREGGSASSSFRSYGVTSSGDYQRGGLQTDRDRSIATGGYPSQPMYAAPPMQVAYVAPQPYQPPKYGIPPRNPKETNQMNPLPNRIQPPSIPSATGYADVSSASANLNSNLLPYGYGYS